MKTFVLKLVVETEEDVTQEMIEALVGYNLIKQENIKIHSVNVDSWSSDRLEIDLDL